MEKLKAQLPTFLALNHREKGLLIVIAALLVAVIAITCISINIRVNMQTEYAALRTKISEAIYSNMNMLTQTFDMTAVPNADIKNIIIPQMKNYFAASVALNELITNAFGPRYQVLSDADLSSLRTAFNSYDAAFRADAPVDLAQADMQACMSRVREILNSRFADGQLKTQR